MDKVDKDKVNNVYKVDKDKVDKDKHNVDQDKVDKDKVDKDKVEFLVPSRGPFQNCVLVSEGGGGYFQIFIFGRYVLMVGQVGKGMLSEIVCKKFHSSFFRFARTSWIIFVRNNPLVRPSARKIWINCTALY